MDRSLEAARVDIAERLRARRAEIEQTSMARVYGIAEPAQTEDPEYLHGLRAAVCAAIEYGVAAVELGEERSPPLPTALLSQARLAARNQVSLDTVLRRYFSGFMLFNDFVLEEAEVEVSRCGISLHRLLQGQSIQFDRLIGVVTEEYNREVGSTVLMGERRRVEQVKRLLAGEPLRQSDLAYDFDGWHLALVLKGVDYSDGLRAMAEALNRRLLRVVPYQSMIWAWLGGRQRLESSSVAAYAAEALPHDCLLALGEPGEGLGGWRLSHRQAMAGLPLVAHRTRKIVMYADIGLLATVLNDEVLTRSLNEIYLAPLEEERDGGEALRETARAYLASGHNVTSAAAALGVSRQTVTNRVRAIEERVGRSLNNCAAELEVALRLEEPSSGVIAHSIPPVRPTE